VGFKRNNERHGRLSAKILRRKRAGATAAELGAGLPLFPLMGILHAY